MKRVGLAVGFAFLVLVASQCFTDPAYADAPNFPPLTPIQEDDAVPEIAKYKELYERATASDWQPAVTVTAAVKNGKSKRYPKADFFCKQIKSTADIQFAAKPKPGTFNFAYARVASIDCASQPGTARMTGVFVWNNGEVWAGEVSATDREIFQTAGFALANDNSVKVYRASAQGAKLVAVAGPQGATLLSTGGHQLYGYDTVQATVYDYEAAPHAKIPARLIIPSMGYFEGRSSVDEIFRVGAYKPPYFFDHEGYGAFYALDDSFRIIGPIFNEGVSWDPEKPAMLEYAKPSWNEAAEPETLVVALSRWCTDYCSPDKWVSANNYFYMASSDGCVNGVPSECDPIRIETRVATILGPPGSYEYNGVVDLTKAPDLSKMLSPKFGVNYGAEPMTFAQHFQPLDQTSPSAEEVRQWQAEYDQYYQMKLEQVEAHWAVEEQKRIDGLAATAQRYANSYAELQAEREVEARKQAATAAACAR